MSEEEEGENKGTFKKVTPGWRSEKVTCFFRELDQRFEKSKPDYMTKPNPRRTVVCNDVLPPKNVPGWALNKNWRGKSGVGVKRCRTRGGKSGVGAFATRNSFQHISSSLSLTQKTPSPSGSSLEESTPLATCSTSKVHVSETVSSRNVKERKYSSEEALKFFDDV